MNTKQTLQLMVKDLNKTNDQNLDNVKIFVDEHSMYRNHETGEIYIGGQLVESEPQKVICL